MKKITAASFLLVLFIAVPAIAQNQGPNPQSIARARAQQNQPVAVRSQPPGELSENHTISLNGTTSTGQEIELALTGIGPEFVVEKSLDDDSTLNCQYQVTEREGDIFLDYTIGMRVRITKTNQVQQNQPGEPKVVSSRVEFREEITRGKVRCRSGESVVISKGKDHSLSITISKAGSPKSKKKE